MANYNGPDPDTSASSSFVFVGFDNNDEDTTGFLEDTVMDSFAMATDPDFYDDLNSDDDDDSSNDDDD